MAPSSMWCLMPESSELPFITPSPHSCTKSSSPIDFISCICLDVLTPLKPPSADSNHYLLSLGLMSLSPHCSPRLHPFSSVHSLCSNQTYSKKQMWKTNKKCNLHLASLSFALSWSGTSGSIQSALLTCSWNFTFLSPGSRLCSWSPICFSYSTF